MTGTAHRAAHPRDVLFDAGDEPHVLPVCDHYAGVEDRMHKSLALQAELGPVFDVTLDCEDGAPVGGEVDHAQMVAELATSNENAHGRVGTRVLALDHRQFDDVLDALIARAGTRWAYLMLPKLRSLTELDRACAAVDDCAQRHGLARTPPLHALIETHGALHDVMGFAAHPRIESLSFGLMDFVSAHHGAIPLKAMSASGQFEHPLVVRAKLEISAACHAFGKTPSHGVVTEFKRLDALERAARQACERLGYLRMWSIHPQQVRTIVEAFSPTAAEVDLAIEIITAAQDGNWAPIRHRDTLHDRASFRYFWYLLERAQATGQPVSADLRERFFVGS